MTLRGASLLGAVLALLALLALTVLAAPRAAQAVEPTLRVDLGGGVALEAVLVPAGTFLQGSPHDEKGREEGELQREVRDP